MKYLLIFLSIGFIAGLAWWMRKATKNTPFKNAHGCAPNLHELERLEKDPLAANKN